MKPDEVAGIAFTAIGKQDEGTWRACVANVPSRTYVGRDFNYTSTLQNQINFSTMAGLQFHKQSFSLFAQLHIQHDDFNAKKKAEMDDAERLQHLMEQGHLFDNENMKYRIVLTLINSLCDKYKIDKKTCLSLAEINMTIDELEATYEVEPRFWSDEVKIYHDDIKYVLETTINPN